MAFRSLCLILLAVSPVMPSAAPFHCAHVVPPQFGYITQPVDHMKPDAGSFQQSVQVVNDFYKPGGPMLFYAGPENAASLYTTLCLNLPAWATQLDAVIVGVEHRYFGNSTPLASAGWDGLTLDNILADYAAVIQQFTGAGAAYSGAKVIVFGGSYGGFLSMLMRVRYPKLVLGSLASAAPLLLWGNPDLDQGLWYDTVAQIIMTKDVECGNVMSESFQEIVTLLETGHMEGLQESLQLCHAPSPAEVKTLLIYLQHATSLVAQFNYPFPSAAKVDYPFEATCSAFRAASSSEDRLAAMRGMLDIAYNNSRTLDCFWTHLHERELSSAAGVARLRIESDGALSDINFAKAWYVICCSFYVMPVDGGNISENFYHFEHRYNFEGTAEYCNATYGVRPQDTPIFDPVVLRSSSNIMFSNQGFDPVHAFSLKESLSSSIISIFTPQAGHTLDICAANDDDPLDVITTRTTELQIMTSWLLQPEAIIL